MTYVASILFTGCSVVEPKHGSVSVENVTVVPASDTLVGFGDTVAVYAQIAYSLADTDEAYSRTWTIIPAGINSFSHGDTLYIVAPGYPTAITATVEARISGIDTSSGSITINVINLAVPTIIWTDISDNMTLLRSDHSKVFSIGARYQRPVDSMGLELFNEKDSLLADSITPYQCQTLTYTIDLSTMIGVYSVRARAWSQNINLQKVVGADTTYFVVNAVDILPKKK
jgi:hypothetical protein